MTLLLRDPDAKAAEPDAETPPVARTCPRCSSPLEPEQDWCLLCGEAQPGRLSALPGRRAFVTVMALTTLIVGGAVAASYAALNDSSPSAPPADQLAQAPSSATPSATEPAPAPPAASTPAPAAPTATTPAPADGGGALPDAGTTPATPAPSPTPAPSSTGTGSGKTTSNTSSDGGSSKSTPRTTTTQTEPPPEPITLADGAATLYDPYHRNTATGDPARAVDGNPSTSFPITVADGATTVGAGLVVDLGKQRGIRELDLTTKTPGFKIELYATDSDELPPDVLDTRWAHVKDMTDVGTGAGGKQIVTLGSGTTKYRHVLLWITTPPKDGLTVRVSELKLLG